jgi:hypothetical protein
MTDVQGYVACIPDKRRHVQTLLQEGRALKDALPDERRHKSFFIVDSPGSGKSFMVDCLTATLAMPTLKFNITACSEREHLTDCFQKLSAAQSENPTSTFVVFFDEMNAKVANQHIYSAFLEPLEDGSYVHNGKTFRLRPCLWIFAGTAAPTEGTKKPDKAQDFESRLSHEIMYLNGSGKPQSQRHSKSIDPSLRVEQVYIGVATIRSAFPDVTKISKKVLKAFSLIDPISVGPRGIGRFVRSFEYVQYGRVMAKNLPPKWREHLEIDETEFNRWETEEESEKHLVEISSRIDN